PRGAAPGRAAGAGRPGGERPRGAGDAPPRADVDGGDRRRAGRQRGGDQGPTRAGAAAAALRFGPAKRRMTPMTSARRLTASEEVDLALAELVDRLTARLHGGEAIDVEAAAAEHPQHAAQLREILPVLAAMAAARSAAGAPPASGGLAGLVLGDFRILW